MRPSSTRVDAETRALVAPLATTFDEQLAARRQLQVDEGRCNLIPFPRRESLPFRVHLMLDQLPLFVVNSFRADHRTMTIVIKLDDDTVEEQTFSVGAPERAGKKGRGVLKQAHQDAFYRLLWKWGELGYPLTADGRGELSMTVGALVHLLFGDDAEHRYARSKELVRDLASIPVTLTNVQLRNRSASVEEFTLLHLDQWSERNVDARTRKPRAGGRSLVRILFSKVVTDGFLAADVKALLLGVYDSLGAGTARHAEVARLLYPLLDHELASKTGYHCKLVKLAERLGLASQAYKSLRVRPFARAVRVLNGKPILGERYSLRVTLRESVDGDDFVLEATRGPWQPSLPGLPPPTRSDIEALQR
jgi:hypothetical protein